MAATAPAPAISEHVSRAATKLFDKGWLDRVAYAPGSRYGDRVVSLTVPSERDDAIYRVSVNTETRTASCVCQGAGPSGERLCKHQVVSLVFLGLLDFPGVRANPYDGMTDEFERLPPPLHSLDDFRDWKAGVYEWRPSA